MPWSMPPSYVIEEQLGCLNMAGLGQENGFIIQGPVDAYIVEEAARAGLARLRGERKPSDP